MHRPTAAAALAVLAATLLTACGGSSDTTTAQTTTAAAPATTTTTTAPATTAPATTTSAAATTKRISIVIEEGQIKGGRPAEVTVGKGTKVVLEVIADVSDEVHLHGYDLHDDVAPGAPARIAFTASIPGRFEAELESRSYTILHLTVE